MLISTDSFLKLQQHGAMMLTRPDHQIGTATSTFAEDDLDDLAPAQFLAELLNRWKFIAVVGLATAFLATVTGYVLFKPTYQSEAYLTINAGNAGRQKAMIHSPLVLDPVITGSLDAGAAKDKARARLREKVTIEPARGEDRKAPSVFVLRVRDPRPEQAHQIATAVIDQFIKSTRPKPVTRERLKAELSRVEAQRNEINDIIGRFETETASLISNQSDTGELATPLSQLLDRRANFDEQIDTLNNQLQGMTTDADLSPPTMPDRALRTVSLPLIAGLGLFLGLVAGAVIVVIRYTIPVLLDLAGGQRHRLQSQY